MNRDDFQRLTELRLADGKALLDAHRFQGSYYLTGYAVECALKACITKQTNQYDFPAKNGHQFYIHDLNTLLKFAGLEEEHRKNSSQSPAFESNWTIVKDWKEELRYSRDVTKN